VTYRSSLLFLLPLLLLVTGCDPLSITAVVSAGSAIGMGAAEERGLEAAIDDTKIRAEINQLWFQNNFSIFKNVSMTVNEGRVLLTGIVNKPEDRIEAVRLTWQAFGVNFVIDEIQVSDTSGLLDYAKDGWIANKLRTSIIFDLSISNINYNIEVVNGIVYLVGIAQNQEELNKVIAYAKNMSDVKKVINHVILKNDPKRFKSP
jgi:osmotically-inducible protein OsmY